MYKLQTWKNLPWSWLYIFKMHVVYIPNTKVSQFHIWWQFNYCCVPIILCHNTIIILTNNKYSIAKTYKIQCAVYIYICICNYLIQCCRSHSWEKNILLSLNSELLKTWSTIIVKKCFQKTYHCVTSITEMYSTYAQVLCTVHILVQRSNYRIVTIRYSA